MLKQKILIVTRSFFPVNSPRSFRASELARGFSKLGHEVTVLTSVQPETEGFARQYNLRIKDMGGPSWKPVPLGKGPSKPFMRAFRRLANLLWLYPELEWMGRVHRALKRERDFGYDMLISIAVPYPVHFGVARARIATHPMASTWVADCGDPFMGQENDSFRYPFYFKYLEKWFCRKADFISVPVRGAIAAYYPEFRDKIRVIPQGFDFSEPRLSPYSKPHRVPTFAYAGGLIPGRRDPAELLRYLNDRSGDFRFHIYTAHPHLVRPYLGDSRGRIVLHEPVPRQILLKELSQMDFLINLENKGARQVPSKLIDYAITRRPILSIRTGALPQEQLEAFLSGDYREAYQVENIGQYRIENVCAAFLALNDYEPLKPEDHVFEAYTR